MSFDKEKFILCSYIIIIFIIKSFSKENNRKLIFHYLSYIDRKSTRLNSEIYTLSLHDALPIYTTGNVFIYYNPNNANCGNNIPSVAYKLSINDKIQPLFKAIINNNDTENTIKIEFNDKIPSTACMFAKCRNIREIDLSHFNSSQTTKMTNMFIGCTALTSLNLKNLDTSQVVSMSYMFSDCMRLSSLDLSNFNTTQVTNMKYMFKGCISLTSLDLNKFNTSKVIDMISMFSGCLSLKYLNLETFDTTALKYMEEMFKNCTSLTSLNLENFNTVNVEEFNNLFAGCYSLQYINLKNAFIKNGAIYYSSLADIPDNVLICTREEKWNNNYKGTNISIICNGNKTNNNLINDNNNACFIKNINNIIYNKYLCQICGKNNYPIINDIYRNNYSFDICDEIPEDFDSSITSETKIKNNIKDLINKINISFIDEGNEYSIKEGNIFSKITNTNNQKSTSNGTTIDLLDCEHKLKSVYNISNLSSLYLQIYEIEIKGMKIPKIEYEVFYPFFNETLQQLNLSECKGMDIDISIPVKITDTIDKYNLSSDYYNNLCYKTTSDFGTDISLTDRKNDFIDNNMTLCEEDCKLSDYNYTTERVKCNCLVKMSTPILNEVKFDKEKLLQRFTDIKNIANINFLKCYKEVFKGKKIIKNIGFYIFLLYFIFYFIVLILFYCKYYYSLISIVKKIYKAKIDELKLKEEKDSSNSFLTGSKNRVKNKNKTFNKNILSKNKNNKNPPKKKKEKKIIKSIDNNINEIKFKKRDKDSNKVNFPKIKKDKKINKNEEKKGILKYSDNELNALEYKEALRFDKRIYFLYYKSLLKMNHPLVFSFHCYNNDYNSQIIKIDLFFISFAIEYSMNALFYDDDTMHKIYKSSGAFDFKTQFPIMIYSLLFSNALNQPLNYFGLSNDDIITFKQDRTRSNYIKRIKYLKKKLSIKFISFFIISFLILVFLWYYISMFCAIYSNTQIHLIKDTLISFLLNMIYPFCIYLIPSIFRIIALRSTKKDRRYIYRFSQIIQII